MVDKELVKTFWQDCDDRGFPLRDLDAFTCFLEENETTTNQETKDYVRRFAKRDMKQMFVSGEIKDGATLKLLMEADYDIKSNSGNVSQYPIANLTIVAPDKNEREIIKNESAFNWNTVIKN